MKDNNIDNFSLGLRIESEHKRTYLKLKRHFDLYDDIPDEYNFYAWIVEDHLIEDPNYYSKLVKCKNAAIIESADRKSRKSRSYVQSLVFSKKNFDVKSAKAWAKKHGYKYGDVDVKRNTIRLRQLDPRKFSRYTMKDLGNGVKLCLGFL